MDNGNLLALAANLVWSLALVVIILGIAFGAAEWFLFGALIVGFASNATLFTFAFLTLREN